MPADVALSADREYKLCHSMNHEVKAYCNRASFDFANGTFCMRLQLVQPQVTKTSGDNQLFFKLKYSNLNF